MFAGELRKFRGERIGERRQSTQQHRVRGARGAGTDTLLGEMTHQLARADLVATDGISDPALVLILGAVDGTEGLEEAATPYLRLPRIVDPDGEG